MTQNARTGCRPRRHAIAVAAVHRRHDDAGHEVAQPEDLRHEVSGRRPERERDEDGEPVEGLASAGADRVDRQRALGLVPGDEHGREEHAEDDGADLERDTEVVGELVGDERAEHADERHRGPVAQRDVAVGRELRDQHEHQQHARGDRGAGEAQVDVDVEEVGGRLPDGGAEHLDDPEVGGDLRHLAHQETGAGRGAVSRHGFLGVGGAGAQRAGHVAARWPTLPGRGLVDHVRAMSVLSSAAGVRGFLPSLYRFLIGARSPRSSVDLTARPGRCRGGP
jgi:hypothetical protein